MAEEPATSEAGDGGEGRRGEAHHHVRHRHVTHQQVHPRVQRGGPGQRGNKVLKKLLVYIFGQAPGNEKGNELIMETRSQEVTALYHGISFDFLWGSFFR